MDDTQKKILKIAGVVVALLVVIGVVVALTGGDDEPGPTQSVAHELRYWNEAPEIWKTPDDAESVAVEIDPARGPLVRVAPAQTIAMTPEVEGMELVWELAESTAERWIVSGKGTLGPASVEATWVFAQGNPQALFSLTINDLPVEVVPEGLDAVLTLPAGDVRVLDDSLRLVPFAKGPRRVSGWTPGWLRWTGTGRTIELSSWWANHTTVGLGEGSSVVINLNLVDPEANPAFSEECETGNITVSTRLKWSLGSLPVVIPGRLPRGAEAAVVPVFIPPEDHFNPAFDDMKEPSAEVWSKQVATLALGHSSPTDPRYGNGGLSGAHLGGTIVAPAGMAGPELAELETRLSDSRVEYAGATGPVFGRPACESGRIWLRDATRFEAGFSNTVALDSAVGFAGESARSLGVEVLDGTREQLLDQALSRLYLERLRRERGVFAFVSPLVATRNPLTTAAKDGLLVPERHGEWTLSPELVRAFADIELWREANASVVFASVDSALGTWSKARACDLHLRASGEVRVICPEPVDSMTLIADGSHVPRRGEQTLAHEVRDPTKRPQTWLWADMTGEASNISLGAENPPVPVNWVIPAR